MIEGRSADERRKEGGGEKEGRRGEGEKGRRGRRRAAQWLGQIIGDRR
jgi:hypothetical protein